MGVEAGVDWDETGAGADEEGVVPVEAADA